MSRDGGQHIFDDHQECKEWPWRWNVPEIAYFVLDQFGAGTLNLEGTEKKQNKTTTTNTQKKSISQFKDETRYNVLEMGGIINNYMETKNTT